MYDHKRAFADASEIYNEYEKRIQVIQKRISDGFQQLDQYRFLVDMIPTMDENLQTFWRQHLQKRLDTIVDSIVQGQESLKTILTEIKQDLLEFIESRK